MNPGAVPPLKTKNITDCAENADSVCFNLLKPDKEFLSCVDIALDTSFGFLRGLPPAYRNVIGVTYLRHMQSCEEKMNQQHARSLTLAKEAFERTKKEGADPDEFRRSWNFRKLQTEDDRLDDELQLAHGPADWGVIDLKVKEQEFTPNRWMIVLINKTQQPVESKKEEVGKILEGKFDDIELIDIHLPKEGIDERKSTILGKFVHNCMFYLSNRSAEILTSHNISSKFHKAQAELETLPNTELMLLLLHYYIKSYRSLMKLRIGPIKAISSDSKAEYVPYKANSRFPKDASVHFQKASPRITQALNVSPRLSTGNIQKEPVKKFYKRVYNCHFYLKRLTVLLQAHIKNNFSTKEKKLADSFNTLSLEEAEKRDPQEAPGGPNGLTCIANVETCTKLQEHLQVFQRVQALFKKIHDYYRKKSSMPFPL